MDLQTKITLFCGIASIILSVATIIMRKFR